MRRFFFVFFVTFLMVMQVFSQEKRTDILILKNGEKYTGEIVMKTDDMLMLKTDDGKRYQFRISEIDKIQQQYAEEKQVKDGHKVKSSAEGSFAGLLDVNGGFSFAPQTPLSGMQLMQATLAFGTKNAFGAKAFLGIGAGYEAVFVSAGSDLAFLPVFIRIHRSLSENIISPSFGVNAGYAFALNELYKGGMLLNLSGGMRYRLTGKTAVYFGLFGQMQQIQGAVVERNELGVFTSKGNALLNSLGLSVSLLF